MIWAIAGLIAAYEFFETRSTGLLLFFFVFGAAAFGGKISAGFVLIVSFVLTDVFLSVRNRSLRGCIARTLLLVALSSLIFYFIIGRPNRLGNNKFELSYKGPGYFFGVDSLRHPLIFLLAIVGVSLALFQIPAIQILALRSNLGDEKVLLLCSGAFISGFIPFLIQTDPGMVYFIVAGLNFAGIGAAISLSAIFVFLSNEASVSNRQHLIIASTAFAISKIGDSIYKFEWREISSLRGGPTPILVGILICSIASYWLVAKAFVSKASRMPRMLMNRAKVMLFLIIILYANLLPKILDYSVSTTGKINLKFDNPYVGSINVQNASKWIQKSTLEDSIFATNRFCVEPRTNFCIDPKLFLVSSTARRKVLIEGPYYVVGYGGDDESLYPKFAKERLDLSRGFADKPTAEIAARLRELGVDWFYLFLDNTENRNWAPFATVEYQNSEVAILKLTDPSS